MVRNKRDKSLHLDHLLPLDHSPEHCVFPVQPWCGHGGEEELRAVGVHTRIGHGQSEGLVTQSAGTRVQGSGFQGLGFQGFQGFRVSGFQSVRIRFKGEQDRFGI